MTTHYALHVISLQDVVWKSKIHSKVPDLYVQVKFGDVIKRTQTVKKSISPTWDDPLALSLSDSSVILNIRVRHESTFGPDPCVGCVDIVFADLLQKCGNDEAQLSLQIPPGKASTASAIVGIIRLRLEVINTVESVGIDIEAAGRSVQQRGIVRSAETAESTPVAVVDTAIELSGENDLYQSIGNLLSKLDVFVEFIDDISKVHPYLNVAWQVASSLYKGVSNQFKADKKIIDLVHAMEEAFDFVRDTQSLPDKTQRHEEIIIGLLKQTAECCHFVQGYTRQGFVRRMLDLNSKQKIGDFEQSLSAYKTALDSGNILYTALISARMSDKVNALFLQSRLDPDKTDAFNRSPCLPGTRNEYLNQILEYLLSETDQNIVWLCGVAGSGKSTIASTIAEYFQDTCRLGAFLFFERGKSKPESVVRTIVYKLASFDSSIATCVTAAIERDNDIVVASAASQFKKLIVEPLTAAAAAMQGPIIVVLDALDECGTPETRRSLMQLFQRELAKLPKNFRFLITSRRETDINQALSSQPSTLVIELDYSSTASRDDVLRYIDHEMRNIMMTRGLEMPADWKPNMVLLSEAAGGIFIWASTAVKLVDCDNPARRLKDLVSNSRILKGLDPLYDSVLRSSGISFDNETSKSRLSQVLGLILHSKTPLSDVAIDGILDFPPDEPSSLILSRLQSVLVYTPGEPIHLFHASFADYLLSSERSGDPWFIDISAQKLIVITRCFGLMKNRLQFNICNIESSYIPNDHIAGLQGRIKEKIPSYLEYACLFWAQHLCEVPYSPVLLNELSYLLYNRLLYWFEVLSLLKKVGRASPALLDAMAWTSTRDAKTLAFLKDAHRTITRFHLPILQATPHIYLSALPLTSKASMVTAHYLKRTRSIVQVEGRGLERQSPLLNELKGHTRSVNSLAFSPNGTRIASGSDDGTIRVWDAENGQVVSGPFEGHTGSVNSVAFSPNGTRIASGSDDGTIRVWDAENGQVVSGPFEGHTGRVNSVAFSPDGTCIVSGSDDGTIRVWDAENGQVVSGPFEGHRGRVNSVAFSPDGTRIASGSYDHTIRVWDAENGQVVSGPFEGHTGSVNSVAFSLDGTRIVSGSDDHTIRVWDAENGQAVSGPFEGHTDSVSSVAFSPDGTRIVSGSNDVTIRAWDVENGQVVSGPFEGQTLGDSSATFPNKKDICKWTLAEDGWVRGGERELLLWIPPDLRPTLLRPQNTAVFSCAFSTKVDFTDSAHGKRWRECFKAF